MKNLITILALFLTFSGISQITLLKDILPGSSTSSVDHITPTDYGYCLFIARESTATGVELWRTDGTTANTYQIKDIYPGSNPSYPLIYHDFGNGTIGMRANNGTNGYEPWITDGTLAGTQLIEDINSGSSNSVSLITDGLTWGTTDSGIHLLSLDDGSNGLELWMTDGTGVGTTIVKDIYVGVNSSAPKDLTELNGGVAFSAYSLDEGRELFFSDGSELGTDVILDINPGNLSSNPTDFMRVGPMMVFSADDGTNGRELWLTDGSAAGTFMIKDINPTGSSNPMPMGTVDGYLLFYADDGVHGEEVWKTDGTEAGTTLVKDINPGDGDSSYIIPYFETMGGRLYFNGTDGVNGTEPWVSDGTEEGTYMVKDARPGPFGSNPNGFYAAGEVLLMSAYTDETGFELWVSDGTELGTQMMEDYNSGLSCSCPADFVIWNDDILFTADNGFTGRELHILGLNDICLAENTNFANAMPLEVGEEYQVSTACGALTGINYGCANNPGKEMWYSFIAPASGEMTIEAFDLHANDIGFNVVLSVFDDLSSVVACENSNGNLQDETIELTGLNAGETYYLCLQNTYDQTGICTLSIPAEEVAPCSVSLQSIGIQTTCNPSDNFYTQEVTFEYISAPMMGTVDLNGQSFTIDGSPQTAVLTDLYSDGASIDLMISFSDEPTCSTSVASAWVASQSCCLGDLNGDLIISAPDLLIFLASFGCMEDCIHDLTGDGSVDAADLLSFLAFFGQVCP